MSGGWKARSLGWSGVWRGGGAVRWIGAVDERGSVAATGDVWMGGVHRWWWWWRRLCATRALGGQPRRSAADDDMLLCVTGRLIADLSELLHISSERLSTAHLPVMQSMRVLVSLAAGCTSIVIMMHASQHLMTPATARHMTSRCTPLVGSGHVFPSSAFL